MKLLYCRTEEIQATPSCAVKSGQYAERSSRLHAVNHLIGTKMCKPWRPYICSIIITKKKSMRAHNILQTTSLFCQIVCDRDTKSYPLGQKAPPVLSYLWRSGRLGNWSSIDRQCHGNDRPSDLCRLVHHFDKWSLFIVRVQVIWGPWSRFTIDQDTTGAYPEIK